MHTDCHDCQRCGHDCGRHDDGCHYAEGDWVLFWRFPYVKRGIVYQVHRASHSASLLVDCGTECCSINWKQAYSNTDEGRQELCRRILEDIMRAHKEVADLIEQKARVA